MAVFYIGEAEMAASMKDRLSKMDQADKGLCGECIEPCDVRDGKEAQQ